MKKLNELIKTIEEFFDNIDNGDQYLNSDPKSEDGLQLDLYLYLKDLGYQVVYELSLPKLKPYLDKELNEAVGFSGFPKDSLRPDLVVNLGNEGFVCVELKYNEPSEKDIKEDEAKCRVYVQYCSDVHYAISLHLHRNDVSTKEDDAYFCDDEDYRYSWYECIDSLLDARYGLLKSPAAYLIGGLWQSRCVEIMNGDGKFAEYE